MSFTRFKPGDIVQYTGKFWKFLNTIEGDNERFDIYDTPMIIIESNIDATRPSCESDMTDKDEIDYIMYNVLQGDNRFEISDAWVELVK